MLIPRVRGVRVRLPGVLLAAALAFAACTVQRTPVDLGPPFLRVVRAARVYDLPALSPPAWAPRGDAVGLGTDGGVWQVPLDGTGPHRLAAIGRVTAVAWGPGRAGLAAVAGGALYTLDPSVSEAVPVAGSANVRLVEWAPRAGRLAYVQSGSDADELIVSDGAGAARSPRRVVLPDGLAARALVWLPDGRGLLIAAGPRGGAVSTRVLRIRAVPPTLTITTALTDAAMSGPALDRTGTLVAYVGGTPDAVASGRGIVTVARLDGSGRRALTPPGTYTGLAWAPFGPSLAFGEVLGADEVALEVVNTATGARLRVIDYRPELPQHGTAMVIRWAPDGLRLAFGTDTGDNAGPVWVATFARQ